jgi:hypothetical protein
MSTSVQNAVNVLTKRKSWCSVAIHNYSDVNGFCRLVTSQPY